jgi:CMP-N,N'-diacetyllegionaminic acid synthase
MILAVIPARGGSRGLRRKNLRLIGGEPMLAHTIHASRAARRVDRTIVSTDSPEIARAATAAGAEVPFLRPAELATDDAPTVAAVDHAVRQIEASGATVDVVVTLQPTSPLRSAHDIDEAIALLERSGADSVVTVAPLDVPSSVVGELIAGRYHPFLHDLNGTDQRRQVAPQVVRLTGAIYVTRRGLLNAGRLLGDEPAALVMDGPAAIDVDDLKDLRAVRSALRRYRPGS